MITYPHPDPVAFEIFGLEVRWYGMMYLIGLFFAWLLGRYLLKKQTFSTLRGLVLEDLMIAAALGVILGGRLGYVLFYNLSYYLENPIDIFKIWAGGMSFHGGLIGVIISLWILSKTQVMNQQEGVVSEKKVSRYHIFLRLVDFAAVLTPPGLGMGRIANFINGELPGRVTSPDLPWAFSFGFPDYLPRHPSQLYQMFMEGFILAGIMLWLARKPRSPGFLAGMFLTFYGCGRFVTEFFREPDSHLGLIFLNLSMGQLLSIPMILLGLFMAYFFHWQHTLSLQFPKTITFPKINIIKNIYHNLSKETDVEWTYQEQTLSASNDNEQEIESKKGNFLSRIFSSSEEDEDELNDDPRGMTRRQKRRLKKKKRK